MKTLCAQAVFLTFVILSSSAYSMVDNPIGKNRVFQNITFSHNTTSNQESFLPVNEAFLFSSSIEEKGVRISFKIAEGYYLYKEKFRIEMVGASDEPELLEEVVATFLQKGLLVEDPYFGLVTIFKNDLSVLISLGSLANEEIELKVRYQGCAETGLCYPPTSKKIMFIPSIERAN